MYNRLMNVVLITLYLRVTCCYLQIITEQNAFFDVQVQPCLYVMYTQSRSALHVRDNDKHCNSQSLVSEMVYQYKYYVSSGI